MISYTIHVRSDDPAATSAAIAVEIGAAGPRVTAVTVCFGTDGTPILKQLPLLEFSALADALVRTSRGLLVREPNSRQPLPPTSPPSEDPRTLGSAAKTASRERRVTPSTTGDPATSADPQQHVGGPQRRQRHAKRAEPRRPNATVTGVPSDFGNVYWRLGTIAKVAEHYEVSRQIARDWIRSLRQGGSLPDPWRKRVL